MHLQYNIIEYSVCNNSSKLTLYTNDRIKITSYSSIPFIILPSIPSKHTLISSTTPFLPPLFLPRPTPKPATQKLPMVIRAKSRVFCTLLALSAPTFAPRFPNVEFFGGLGGAGPWRGVCCTYVRYVCMYCTGPLLVLWSEVRACVCGASMWCCTTAGR